MGYKKISDGDTLPADNYVIQIKSDDLDDDTTRGLFHKYIFSGSATGRVMNRSPNKDDPQSLLSSTKLLVP